MRSAETPLARTAAALLALIAWAGIVIQFHATLNLQASTLSTIWALLRSFTITTNLLVSAVFTGIAAGRCFQQLLAPRQRRTLYELCWTRAMTNAILMAIAFLGASWLFIWFDSLLGRRSLDPPLFTSESANSLHNQRRKISLSLLLTFEAAGRLTPRSLSRLFAGAIMNVATKSTAPAPGLSHG
jgi:hypothetical protein